MKNKFALALLANVAVVAAMATDASAGGHGGGGGGGGHGVVVASMAVAAAASMAVVAASIWVAAACAWAAAACKGAAEACTWAAAAACTCTEPHSLGWVATMARSTAAGSPGGRFVQPSRESDLARNDPLPAVQPATLSVSGQTSARQRKDHYAVSPLPCRNPRRPHGKRSGEPRVEKRPHGSEGGVGRSSSHPRPTL